MSWHETPVEIRYADTDQMGVVHHAVYPIYCEIGRTRLMASRGLPYRELEAAGIYLMVVDMTCRFKAPCRYGDEVVVKTRISQLKRRLIAFEYQVARSGSPGILFEGTTKHLFSKGTEGTVSCPEPFWPALSKIAAGENA